MRNAVSPHRVEREQKVEGKDKQRRRRKEKKRKKSFLAADLFGRDESHELRNLVFDHDVERFDSLRVEPRNLRPVECLQLLLREKNGRLEKTDAERQKEREPE